MTPPNLGKATPIAPTTTAPSAPPTVSAAPAAGIEGLPENRVKPERDRLRQCILSLNRQVRNRSILDQFLSCLNPGTAIDGRLPFTAAPVLCVADRMMLLHNLIAHAVLAWGRLARGESTEPNPHLVELERILDTKVGGKQLGFLAFFAYPKDKNGAIHVLRTEAEQRALVTARASAAERALEAKAKIREANIDGEDKTEGDVGGGVG